LQDVIIAEQLAAKPPLEISHAEQDGPWVALYFNQTQTSAAEIAGKVMDQYTVMDLVVEEPSIEKTVAELYRGV
jgi:ABC-type uncharacterized transport system ATPase subunit